MKVIFVTENLGSGGAERQLTGLAAMMARDGIDCTVVTWVDKNFYARTLAEAGVSHILLHPASRLDRIAGLARIYRRIRPDAVIAFLPMANETALLASLFYRVKVIVSERSFTSDWGWRRKLTNFLYRRAQYIVANSCNEARNLKKHMPAVADRILAIPNFVDCSLFDYVAVPKGVSDRINLVGVGRVIPSKNILRLVEALATLKRGGYKFDLKWYGDTYDKEYLSILKSAISRLELADCVFLMGECHDMPAAYGAADCFVMPSLLEGYPNVLVEAMACGLPVAVSAVCEHPYIVKDGSNGYLFNPTDTQSITSAIEKLLQLNSSERNEIGRRNRQHVLENNNLKIFKEKYMKLI